tara:strand:+ start:391 stop:960 length:570 start_codon:yes stop_codon:yes gene_type:complete
MKRLIKRILREHKEFKNKLFNLLNSGQDENIDMVKYLSEGQGYDLKELLIEYFQEYGPPYFNIFNVLEIPEEEQEYILTKIYGYNVDVYSQFEKAYGILWRSIDDDKGDNIYREDSDDGWWEKWENDDNSDNWTYHETSDGYWEKYEYDNNGNEIYYENSSGSWAKREYDDNGKQIYYEGSNGIIWDRR